ncbi:MAG: hypothetical protein NT005_01950 [Spirochaetes bacterium]|nr:hypothetical protein [Spirochaetota bacterium]
MLIIRRKPDLSGVLLLRQPRNRRREHGLCHARDHLGSHLAVTYAKDTKSFKAFGALTGWEVAAIA